MTFGGIFIFKEALVLGDRPLEALRDLQSSTSWGSDRGMVSSLGLAIE